LQTDGDAHDGTTVPTRGGEARPELAGMALGGWFEAMGLELIRATSTEVLAEWTVGERHLQPLGLVHGGVYASVVESCCSIGAMLAAPEGKQVVGVENHTSFLRPVRSGRLRARAVALHAGRQAQLWECAITDEADRLVATGRLRALCVDASAGTRPPR
jgi:1,4-dihydroxy-2-naphthoyl-CoA hydrolase